MTAIFGATSTTDDVLRGVDLKGKRVLVTGVSAGLGVETARALAAHGAEVVGAARDLAKAERATADVRAQAANGGGLALVELDLASLKSVRACADALVADGRPFDVVIANAGVMRTPFGHTEDGFETQFGTNHLGPFRAGESHRRPDRAGRPAGERRLLRPPLMRMSIWTIPISRARPMIPWSPMAAPRPPTSCSPWSSTAAIARAASARRHCIRAESRPSLDGHMQPGELEALVAQINAQLAANGQPPFQFKTIPQGAATSVWAGFVAPADDVGSHYCENCQVSQVTEGLISPVSPGVRPYALDPEHAKALWAKSEEMVGGALLSPERTFRTGEDHRLAAPRPQRLARRHRPKALIQIAAARMASKRPVILPIIERNGSGYSS